MRYISGKASAMIDRVLAADTQDFVALVRAAGLSPANDFRDVLLRNVDFANCELDAFDFSGAILVACRFDGAFIAGARFDGTSFRDCDLHGAADFKIWALANGAEFGPTLLAPMARSGPDSSLGILGRSDMAALPSRQTFIAPSPALSELSYDICVRCLCEIVSLPQLRRSRGDRYADNLIFALAHAIEATIPLKRIASSYSVIDFIFERDSADGAAADLERAWHLLPSVIDIDGREVKLELRFGAAAMSFQTLDEALLFKAAESALERAHDAAHVVMIDVDHNETTAVRETLYEELPGAIANDQLFLQYQPKVNLRRQLIPSAEALVRWRHPARGLILPNDFLPAAEEMGGIEVLTLWVLNQVIDDQRALSARGHDLVLFFDLSAVLLRDTKFIESLCEVVEASGAKIGIEIAETAVIRDPETVLGNLQIVAEHGIEIAIDDYGAGLSSLAYLKQIPAAELKIDRMFVKQLTSSNRDPLIVRSTIDLAHALEMEVTAEGVETPAALALLLTMGCDLGQGYLFSRPLEIEAFGKFLAEAERTAKVVPTNAGGGH